MTSLLDRPRLIAEGDFVVVVIFFRCRRKRGAELVVLHISPAGASPKDGVPDMTIISEIDEYGINENLRVRYKKNKIYVS